MAQHISGQSPNAALIGKPGSRAQLTTPALVIDLDALERNIARMADYCRKHNVSLRPHAKTHKSVKIAEMQIAAGAVGICAATLGEAEVLAGAGIPGVLITSPVVGDARIARLIALNEKAEGLKVVTDNPDIAETLSRAAGASGKPLEVFVELDIGTRRTGARSPEAAVAVARQVAQSNSLVFAGIHAYAGHLQHIEDYEERRAEADRCAQPLAILTEQLDAEGLLPPIVSGAGTGSHEIDALRGNYTEMQCGSYVFTDVQYNACPLRRSEAQPFEEGLFVQTTVISANGDGLAITDGGLKRFATDGPAPEILRGAPEGSRYMFKGDEHGAVVLPDGIADLPVGTTVDCLSPHCDPTVNLYDHYHVIRGDTLVDIWPVDARGVI
jgi:D-serine deaminase-like pyridoxal phosphate-dependent protein